MRARPLGLTGRRSSVGRAKGQDATSSSVHPCFRWPPTSRASPELTRWVQSWKLGRRSVGISRPPVCRYFSAAGLSAFLGRCKIRVPLSRVGNNPLVARPVLVQPARNCHGLQGSSRRPGVWASVASISRATQYSDALSTSDPSTAPLLPGGENENTLLRTVASSGLDRSHPAMHPRACGATEGFPR
jgi:hypothetical protein